MGKRILSLVMAVALICMSLTPGFSASAEAVDISDEIVLDTGSQDGGDEDGVGIQAASMPVADPVSVMPPVNEVNEEDLNQGLWAEYFKLDRATVTYEEKTAAREYTTGINHARGNNSLNTELEQYAGSSDYVGIRWTGYIRIPAAGEYIFRNYSDNGVRLYLDDELVIDWWELDWDKYITSDPISYEEGQLVKFQFDFMEWNGGEHVTLSWSDNNGGTYNTIPANVFWYVTPDPDPEFVPRNPSDKNGLMADYYKVYETTAGPSNGYLYGDFLGSYIEENIDVADMDSMLKSRVGREDYTGIRYTSLFEAPEDGTYTFSFYSDNGAKVTLDGKQIITWWGNHYDEMQSSGPIELKKGQICEFKMDYFEWNGSAHVYLYYQNDNTITERTIIPADRFYLPEDYDGIYVSEIDTSAAQLEKTEENFGGEITVKGQNLDADDLSLELLSLSGLSLATKYNLDVVGKSNAAVTFEVPKELDFGYYRIKAAGDGVAHISTAYFGVTREGYQDRAEHPRPDWKRSDSWVNLNGFWDFAFDPAENGTDETDWYTRFNQNYNLKINVPFAWESPMSGITNTGYRGVAWYQRELVIDENMVDSEKYFLKFGAVDAKCWIYLDGEFVTDHDGGYTAFEVDITDYIKDTGSATLTVRVEDKASYGKDSYPALVGKQGHNAPCGYTHSSGIWQTVILEGRQSDMYMNYVQSNPTVADANDASSVDGIQFDMNITNEGYAMNNVKVVYDFKPTLYNQELDITEDVDAPAVHAEQTIAEIKKGTDTIKLNKVAIDDPQLWSDTKAVLYEGTITLYAGDSVIDQVETYFGLRTVTAEQNNYDNGVDIEYIHVNGEPVFLSGLLDQGYWEEGIYTAPTEDALKYDIQAMRDRNFNMIRKHLKIEDPLQYYWADKIGMYVWQDMPHSTAMIPENGEAPGRELFEYSLEKMMTELTYNHPSIIAIMLFNETWGLWDAYHIGDRPRQYYIDKHNSKANGMNSQQWVEYCYWMAKDLNPNILIEEMSPCNKDHIEATDLNTFHMYPKGYASSKNDVDYFTAGVTDPSLKKRNYYNPSEPGYDDQPISNEYKGQPFLNSEYGGVAAYDKDWDVSWCFKYQTDLQRMVKELNGYVYTEPFDVEYERNGILSYDRRDKVFGYDEVAYGGDMDINDLNQPEYIGIKADPALKAEPGSVYKAQAISMRWTPDDRSDVDYTVKWRFDATDVYGNSITTGIKGQYDIEFAPYQQEVHDIEFTLPTQNCVGTITIWIEDNNGDKVAKNFINVIVTNGSASSKISYLEDGTLLVKTTANGKEADGVGKTSLTFDLPEDFKAEDLEGMRLLTELSSKKGITRPVPTIENSEYSQTTVGSEYPSDVTVTINGVYVETVNLPDNPRDIRGTLTLPQALNGGSSAGNFGYLMNLNLTDETLAKIAATLEDNYEIVVEYEVKEDAANQGGVRLYNESNGRYAVNPTLVINPSEVFTADDVITVNGTPVTAAAATEDNISAEAVVSAGAELLVRYDGTNGYSAGLNADGTKLILKKTGASADSLEGSDDLEVVEGLAPGEHNIKVTLFDDRITVYVDNNPEPVINVYDYSKFSGGVAAAGTGTLKGLVVSPETYDIPEEDGQENVQFVDHFSINLSQNKTEKYDMDDYYEVINHTHEGKNGSFEVSNNKLNVVAPFGQKAVIKGITVEDAVIEADIVLDQSTEKDPNMGFVFRATDFIEHVDGARGYYVGIGFNRGSVDNNPGRAADQGFIQFGKMDHGWTTLKQVAIPKDIDIYDTAHRLRVEAVGPRIQVYLDDVLMMDEYDDTYASGGVAMRGFLAKGSFDNIVVSTAPRYSDLDASNLSEFDTIGTITKADGGISTNSSAVGLVGNLGWSDYLMSADITVEQNAKAGVAVHGKVNAEGKYSGYQVLLDEANNKVQFVTVRNDITTVLSSKDVDLAAGTYALAVKAVNNGYKVYLDGAYVMTVINNNYFTGKAGVVNAAGNAKFANLEVTDEFVYEDNFEDGTLEGWNIVSGNYSVENNTLYLAEGRGMKMVDGYATWSDYVVSGRIRLDRGTPEKANAGFIFRTSEYKGTSSADDQRGYVAGVNHNNNANAAASERSGIELGRFHKDWTSLKNDTTYSVDPSAWYDLEVHVEANKINVYVNNQLVHQDIQDDSYVYGIFGIRNYQSGVWVQNFRATPMSLYDDEMEMFEAQVREMLAEAKAALATSGVYTDASLAQLENAVTKAEAILNGALNTYNQILSAYELLADGLDNLVAIEDLGDKSDLQALYNEVLADDYQEDDYTEASYQALKDALAKAAAILKDDYEATQTEVDEALNALKAAVDGLVALNDGKDKLKELVAKADSLDGKDYETTSWDLMQQQLTKAKAVLDNGAATEKDIEHAYNMLYLSMGLLQKKDGSVNKLILEIFIEAAEKAIESGEYDEATAEVQAAFDIALTNARTTYANQSATQADVMEAALALLQQLHNLGIRDDETEVDKSRLEEYYNVCLMVDTSQYGGDAEVAEFDAAMLNAKAVLDDPNATQEQVDAAYDRLVNAFNALERIVTGVDKSWLSFLLEYSDIVIGNKDKYVEKGWAEFIAAYEEGAVVYRDSEDQDEVDGASEKLANALAALRYKADKSALGKAMAQAFALDLSIYTDESVKVLTDLLAKAEAMMADETLTYKENQDEVDKLTVEIMNAIKALVKKGSGNPGGGSGSGSGNGDGTDDDTRKPGSTTGLGKGGKNNAKTGDTSNIQLLVIFFAVSVICAVGVVVTKKRRVK